MFPLSVKLNLSVCQLIKELKTEVGLLRQELAEEREKKEGVLLSFGLCRISQLLPRGLGAQSLFIDASRARRKGFFCQRPGRLRRSTGERRKRRISIVVISKRDKGQNETRDGLPKDIVSSIITETRLATLAYSTNEPVVVISFSH